jgi:uncharacterized protein (TIGR03000 family)
MWSKTISWLGALAVGGAAFLWPQAGQAQRFQAPAAGTLPPGYRSSTLPPRYGSSSLPPVPYYDMRDYHPVYPPLSAPPQEELPEEAPNVSPGQRRQGHEPPAPDNVAVITARVPTDAELRFDGLKMPATGPLRQFKTPPLKPGQRYAYTVEAHWKENGREVTQTQHLPVSAGANVRLFFPLATAGGATGAASPR